MSEPTSASALATEISTQPADWLWAEEVARAHADLLPKPGERVAVVGCGTSLFMAQCIAGLRESAGHGVTDAWPASEHRLERGYDRLLALTRSGTTTEVIDLLTRWGRRLPTTVITADPQTPVVELADPIGMPDVDERSVVQTRFATTALAVLRWHLGEDLRPAAAQAQRVLDADEESLGPARTAEQFTFVGRGWTNGLANESALKLRESAQLWTESYPMTEYRHGPISISSPQRVVWAFGDVVPHLAEDVADTGAHFEHAPDIDPMADLLRVHRLCLVWARQKGLDPDQPRHLSRSIVLRL
ncbi:MAG: sugar isomerase [Propionibacteriales bacterium]|nr:sugar isomerase [Propionibacteriales bacterium]